MLEIDSLIVILVVAVIFSMDGSSSISIASVATSGEIVPTEGKNNNVAARKSDSVFANACALFIEEMFLKYLRRVRK